MIVYFANRGMDILGLASTELRGGFTISDDDKYEDIDTGVTQFECTIHWDEDTRLLAKTCTEAGNYLLRSNGDEHEFYTIIEVEEDTKEQATYIYAEDAGMDLLNETVGAFAADSAYPAKWYIEMFAEDSGFEIGINEISSLSRKLEWTGEATVAERIASVATQFDNAEIGYSFTIDRLVVTHKYINIYEKRGQDAGVTLRLNREVDRIVTTTSVADLATALYVTGGTEEGEEEPVTLVGYVASESDGDIYTDGDGLVKSKSALAIWSRYVNPSETGTGEGHIVHQWSYDTTSQSELYNRAVTQLKKVYTPAVNYDIEITNMPDNIGIGDYVYIVDEGGEVYLQARVLQMETSVCNETQRLTLGDYVINSGGLSSQVGTLTTQVSSLQSQATSTAADVYNLTEEVSELSSSTVKSSESVEITLYNSTGTATGTLRFSSGMSLSLSALFSDYATQNWVSNQNYATQSWVTGTALSGYATQSWVNGLTAQIRLYTDYGYAYAPFGFQSPLDMSIQNLLPDLSGYVTQSDTATIKVTEGVYTNNFDFSFANGATLDISGVMSNYATRNKITVSIGTSSSYSTSGSASAFGGTINLSIASLLSSYTASTATKLANSRTFALRYNSSNLSTATFDGSANVNLDVDNLMSKSLTFSGSDTFTKPVTITDSYGSLYLSGSLVGEDNSAHQGGGIMWEDKCLIWGFYSAHYISVGNSDTTYLYVGAIDESDTNVYIGNNYSSSANTVQLQGTRVNVGVSNLTSNVYIRASSHIYMSRDYEISSDRSIKKDISTLDVKESLINKIDALEPVSFRYKDGDDESVHYGYIAQDVQKVFPDLVTEHPARNVSHSAGGCSDGVSTESVAENEAQDTSDEDEETILAIRYNGIIPLLHMKIKEQQATIDSLEERIAKLEAIIYGEKERD